MCSTLNALSTVDHVICRVDVQEQREGMLWRISGEAGAVSMETADISLRNECRECQARTCVNVLCVC